MSTRISFGEFVIEFEGDIDQTVLGSNDKVSRSEKVIGTLTKEEISLFSLQKTIIAEFRKTLFENEGLSIHQINSMKRKIELVSDLFWFQVHNRLKMYRPYEGDGLGIREGWKVVILPENREDKEIDLSKFIKLN